jgi:MipA family protein
MAERGRALLAFVALQAATEPSLAGILQGLQDIDINDYAIGLGVTSTENVYSGAQDSTTIYPYLGRLFPADFDDGLLFSRAGGYGLRWLPRQAWEFGALARIQTLGFETDDSNALVGLPSREWTVEVGPTIGWRGSTRFDWTAFVDLLRNHHGTSHLFRISVPVQYPHGYLIPEIAFHHYSDQFVDYYFGVPATAATAARPPYAGHAATGMSLGVAWGVELSGKWLLTGKVDLEFFGSGISESPIVEDRDRSSLSLHLTYDGTLFRAPAAVLDSDLPLVRLSLDIARIHTDVASEPQTGSAADALLYFDASFRVARSHEVGLGVLDMAYPATTQTLADRDLDARNLHLVYGFTLLRDRQKMLNLQAGVHFSKLNLGNEGSDSRVDSMEPRPMLGAEGAAHFAKKLSVSAKARLFVLDVDRHSSYQIFMSLGLQHRTFDRANLGIGYVFNRVSLTSDDPDLAARIEPLYRGPSVFVTGSF